MRVENRLGQDFESLAKRILYSYIATYPVFLPVDNGISEESQKQFYDFIADTLLCLYDDPGKLGITEEPDQCYENWQMNNSRPTLIKAMEKIEYKFEDYIELLIKIGTLAEAASNRFIIPMEKLKLTKGTLCKLEHLGIACEQNKEYSVLTHNKYPLVFEAWKHYASCDDKSAKKITRVISFIHSRYDEKKYKAVDFFADLIECPGKLADLENYLADHQFQHANADGNMNVRYAFVKWTKEYPKKETAYMRAFFDWRKKNQMTYEFRVPNFRILLHSYKEMDMEMKRFIYNRLKTCDGCGYCTQTDKSGKRPVLAMELEGEESTLLKCPLYPYFTWNYLNDKDMKQMIKLLELSEKALQ